MKISEKLLKILSQNLNNLEQAQKEVTLYLWLLSGFSLVRWNLPNPETYSLQNADSTNFYITEKVNLKKKL